MPSEKIPATMSRIRNRLRPRGECGRQGRRHHEENTMAKYLLLKHYRGAPAAVNDVPMDQWTPDEVEAHIEFMKDFAAGSSATASSSTPRRCRPTACGSAPTARGAAAVIDGPFAETKDLIAGWMVIDVDSYERAIELAGELSAAPGAGGEPIHEWLEVRPFMSGRPPSPSDGGRRRAACARPTRAERPRPSRCRLRDGRGRGPGGADPGARRVGRRAARRPDRVGSSPWRGAPSST